VNGELITTYMEVITRRKKKFLQAEYKAYPGIFKDYKEYTKLMAGDAMACKNCGIYFWRKSEKRCSCGY
jgi:hypothetical protein